MLIRKSPLQLRSRKLNRRLLNLELCGILGDEAIRRRGLPAPG